MNTYLRLISFSKPYVSYVPEYIIFVLLGIIFGAVNFPMLIPLLNILFGTYQLHTEPLPPFSFSATYFIDLFNYYFNSFLVNNGKAGALLYLSLLIVVFVLLANIFRYWSQRILARMRTRLVKNLRQAVFTKLNEIEPGYFLHQKKGNLLSILSNDLTEIENSLVISLQSFMRDPITIIIYFIILFIMSAKLTFFTLILFPFSGIIVSIIARRLRKQSGTSQVLLGNLLSISEETISGSKVIKAFNAENEMQQKFDLENEQYRKSSKSIYNQRELASPFSEFIGVSVAVVVLLFASYLILNGDDALSAGTLISYLALYSQILQPAKNITTAFTSIQRGMAAGNRVLGIVDTPVTISEEKNAMPLHIFNRSIEYQDVSFGYEEKRKALDSVNAIIPKGAVVALVGPSGSGKTTFADLLPRFYDPTEGKILIDGADIKQIKLKDLRSMIGIVTQEPILFNDTVFNNIALGFPGATEDQVMEAAKIANAHDFIMRMEKGYQTFIGDRGSKMSGGEKQRLTIARAVLKNPPILILDEATSSLDTESERLVQDALFRLMKNRTSLVIAHRLSTIQNADLILVMQKGKIIERGTHSSLHSQDGLYKHLVELQMIQ